MAIQKPVAEELASIKLGDFVGGSFNPLPDIPYVLKHTVVTYNYGGNGPETLALKVDYTPSDENGALIDGAKEITVHYSAGDIKKFKPSRDGNGFVKVGTAVGLGSGSNFFVYLEHMINSGFPEAVYDNDVTVFNGLVVKVQVIPEPKRNLPVSNLMGNAAPDKAPKLLAVISQIIGYVGELAEIASVFTVAAAPKTTKKAAPVTAKKSSAPVAIAAPVGDGDDLLQTYLSTVLNGQKTMSRTKVRIEVFRAMNNDKVAVEDRDAAIKQLNDDAHLDNVLALVGDGYSIKGVDIVAV